MNTDSPLQPRRAFTLIEVMVAVVITMLLAVSLYRFLSVSLEAIASTTETTMEQEKLGAFFDYVEAQLHDIPPKGQGLLLGTANKFHDLSSDEMQLLCRPGSGTLTTAAIGEYKVTLMLRPQSETSRVYDLGLRRRPVDGNDKEVNWVPLLRDVAALEIRYYHPQLNAYIERWNDQNTRPMLVKISLWKTKDSLPLTAVLTIPAAQVQQ